MSQQPLNIFLTNRLTEVGEDIYSFVKRITQQYQEELYQVRRENVRLQQLLDMIYKPDARLQTAVTDAAPPNLSDENSNIPGQQFFTVNQYQEEPHSSRLNNKQTEEVWINHREEQLSSEDSSDGDALTQELIKTVKQLEDRRATEEGLGTNEDPTEVPNQGEKRLGATLYRCHICHHMFTKKIVLTWHQKIHEIMSPKPKGNFVCHLCGKRTLCATSLQSHLRVHTGERPYFCLICGESFNLKKQMTEHIRSHDGEEPFSCHSCAKSFSRYSTLRKHVFAKHSD